MPPVHSATSPSVSMRKELLFAVSKTALSACNKFSFYSKSAPGLRSPSRHQSGFHSVSRFVQAARSSRCGPPHFPAGERTSGIDHRQQNRRRHVGTNPRCGFLGQSTAIFVAIREDYLSCMANDYLVIRYWSIILDSCQNNSKGCNGWRSEPCLEWSWGLG